MTAPPANPTIFHITHVDNLAAIVTRGELISDVAIIASGGPTTTIGMSNIKQRRLTLPVSCHIGLNVGDCVPFYFCPRSLMLFVIHKANHPDLTYRGGQGPIVHLEADLQSVVSWAQSHSRPWAFSLSNAGSYYAVFRNSLADLTDVDWAAVGSTDFRKGAVTPSGTEVSEGKQAEFLLQKSFPWTLVKRIGVLSAAVAAKVHAALSGASHQPQVSVLPSWYF